MKKLRISTLALALGLAGIPGVASAQGICQSGDTTPTIVPAGDITTNTSWSGLVILQGPVFVKNNAILTIAAGSVVRGQPRQFAVVEGETGGTPGALIVTQTGRINAQGSASNPIIFTTAATDNDNNGIADDVVSLTDPDAGTYVAGADGLADPWDPADLFLDDTCNTAPLAPLDKSGVANVQLWGGVVLLGEAPTNNANKCGVGYGKCTIEGLTFPGFPAENAVYGGVLPHDSSGVMRYFSIRHAGDELGNGNELNGLSMGGVGDGTVIEFGEVYANFDDGFEWFGGTVNGRNLVVAYVGDDMFDADEGYTGVNQFLFGVMPFFNENFVDCDPGVPGNQPCPYGSASGDKAMELDGDNYRPDNTALNDNVNIRREIGVGALADATPWPLSGAAFYNATLIGSTPDVGQDFTPVSAASTNRGIQFRNGYAGDVFNSIVVNTGAETGIEVDTSLTAGAPGFNAIDNVNNNLVRLVCSTLDDGAAPAAQETTAINNGNTFAVRLGGSSPGSNNAVNLATTAFLVDEDTTFDPTGDAAGKLVVALKPAPIDPRPAAGGFPPPPTAGCPQTRGTGLDVVTYRGAFQSGAPLWTGSVATNSAWTVLSQSGLLAQ